VTDPTPAGARIAVIQHEDGCPLGLFEPWLQDSGAELDIVRPYRGDRLPALAGGDALASPDGLIVLGGSTSATDDERAPWLPAVRDLLRHAVDRAVPTLGICLGHQLLAVAGGGVVEPNPAGRQMGVLPVGFSPSARREHLFASAATRTIARALQWNSDIVVRLPDGATVLASTPQGIPQVMRLGDAAWGVQFHPEVDDGIVGAWATEDGPVTPAESLALADLAATSEELATTWQPIAARFAAIAAERRAPRAGPDYVTVT
jgi:GMP synthase (glutamine-hydrolysing)